MPYVNELQEKLGPLSILDIGCGRGEWLEMLRDNKHMCKGVDANRIMVETCLRIGLDVVECDVIEFLKKQPSNSLHIISGFHIVEHLPFTTLIDLCKQIYRCLIPGGMLILETPNPENIITGACDFYTDFTHLHPIPVNSLMFLAEYQHFVNPIILRLHPDNMQQIEQDKLQQLLYGPRDYALITYKA